MRGRETEEREIPVQRARKFSHVMGTSSLYIYNKQITRQIQALIHIYRHREKEKERNTLRNGGLTH